MIKPLTVWITSSYGKFLERWEYQSTLPVEPDMEQPTRSKSGKECDKAVYCHPAYLTYMQSSVQLLSCVQLFGTPWTAAYQAPLSMEFSRQEYWNGVPLPSPYYTTLYVISIHVKLLVFEEFLK